MWMWMLAGWHPRKVYKFVRFEDFELSIGQCYTQRCSTFCTLFFSCNSGLSLLLHPFLSCVFPERAGKPSSASLPYRRMYPYSNGRD